MLEKNIEALLSKKLGNDLPKMWLSQYSFPYINEVIEAYSKSNTWALIADENTWVSAGDKLLQAIDTRYDIKRYIFSQNILPDELIVRQIQELFLGVEGFIALGSGTINDLVKYASAQLNKPYIVVPTAPSMNGYLSANASIIINGHKQSVKAHLPVALIADIDVLSSAPIRLIRAGLGDSLARSTAQADWLLSHHVLGTAYDADIFALTSSYEAELLKDTSGLARNDKCAIELLTKILLLSGFGMTIAGGSYPASQGEHMIAHTLEMLYPDVMAKTYHGEQIGVTSITMAKLQEEMILKNISPVLSDNYKEIITSYFSKEYADDLCEQYTKKVHLFNTVMSDVKRNLTDSMDDIKKVMLTSKMIEGALLQCGAITTPEALGITNEQYSAAVAYAKYTRDRFTFLDL